MFQVSYYEFHTTFPDTDEDGDMDVHDRGMLYYRLLKQDVKQAQKIVCGQAHLVAEKNTIIPRVSMKCACSCCLQD